MDLFSRQGTLSSFALRRGERVRVQDGAISRAKGPKRLAALTNNTHAYTFADDTKYATFSPHLIPAGGWFAMVHFVATRTANTSWVVGSIPSGQTFNILGVTLTSAGAPAVVWRDSAGTDHTITGAVVADGSTVHMLIVYDAVNGTYKVYINGSSIGTPETGLASTLQPDQSTVTWTLGVKKITGSAVTANTHFDGAIDSLTLGTLRGVNPTAGSPSMIDTLLAHSLRQWPNPADAKILAHYDLDEAAGSVMYDRSKHKNHGTYVGGPTPGTSVALAFPVGNYIGTFQTALGARTNLASAGGALFYETVRSSP